METSHLTLDTVFIPALRLVAHFWLEEVQAGDLETIAALPELAATISSGKPETVTGLAVEYQRLLGFNLPPYESVFVDPSAMLDAPATGQVQALYHQGGWMLPPGLRAGAPDHLGLELLALAEMLESGRPALAWRLWARHLALWVPAFLLTLQRLDPHPFFSVLSELTTALLLDPLPQTGLNDSEDPFPILPPAPVYRGTFQEPPHVGEADLPRVRPGEEGALEAERLHADRREDGVEEWLRRLLTPCRAGLYITRHDLAVARKALELPGGVAERSQSLKTLFQLAGQYDLLPALFERLDQIFDRSGAAYAGLAEAYPAWTGYAQAWQSRLLHSRTELQRLAGKLQPTES